jgi:probable F420-dependent oxidoreductase
VSPVNVEIGLAHAPTMASVRPDELGRAAEERGFSILFVSQHTHVPVSLATQYPSGAEVPDHYRHLCDQVLWMAAVAPATTRLRVATGVSLVAVQDPILLAKQLATLDAMSEGRLTFGIGYGWQREELANHGIDPAKRRAILREKVLAVRELWTKDVASFDGEFVRFSESWCWPKPVQVPHPPIYLGASGGPTTFDHIVEFCDGWLIRFDADVEKIAALRDAAEAAGRDPASIRIAVQRADPDPANVEVQVERGAEMVTFPVPPVGRDEVLRLLDRYVEVRERVGATATPS